jgi:hypothetical protein
MWISERIFVSGCASSGNSIGFKRVKFHVSYSAGESVSLFAWAPRTAVELTLACNLVVRLLATSMKLRTIEVGWISAPDLSQLLKASRPCLAKITLNEGFLGEDHCRVLAAASRPGLDIVLKHCRIVKAGARIFAGSLRLNQGPTEMNVCDIDNAILAEALRGKRLLELSFIYPG